ncbi:hypothetical protein SAMN05421736_11972 [Evansella caseinilytica]|uniref:Uncharacterized protein n=1 Tax=Evansella caseinilytica TaxID=1503961 RepID=A0A1H3U8X3_9BACI|nr:hypothetical protein [Evansella caseinilytica]SDZ58882.1 hypothetical protein SAMN05421736_11972 [Evansella caseinilytica]
MLCDELVCENEVLPMVEIVEVSGGSAAVVQLVAISANHHFHTAAAR